MCLNKADRVGEEELSAIEAELSEAGAGLPGDTVDTFRVLYPEAENTGTFCAFKGRTSGAKIDYIFVLPGTKVLAAQIDHYNRDGQYPSDHFPVTASLGL